ncbi:MAG: hypothetical protein ACLSVD_10395 [Eggerthellaceae bacterium]
MDPSLAEERELRRNCAIWKRARRRRHARPRRDRKGFIALNFFNLFWIFVVCCVLGLMIETVYHFLVVNQGTTRIARVCCSARSRPSTVSARC